MMINESYNNTFMMDMPVHINPLAQALIYFQMATCPIGVIGNLISLLVFIRLDKKSQSNSNTSFIYCVLCVLNVTITIEANFVRKAGLILVPYIELPCQMETFIRMSLFDSITWMQVLITFDRFILVMFPAKVKIISKRVF